MAVSGLIGSKRPIYSLAPSPYVGPANKRLNLGYSSHVGFGQPYPYPIDMTRRNIVDGWTPYNYNVTTNNGYGMPDRTLNGNSSIYRGVTRYQGHFKAFVWDYCATAGKLETGVYMGGYYREVDAAMAYDLAALKIYGIHIPLNFPLSIYRVELEKMNHMTKSQYLASINRNDCRRDAVPMLGQNPRFTFYPQGTPSIDASRYPGGLEDKVRGFVYGGNDRRRDVEPALGRNPSFSYDIDASRYSGGLEDVVRCFINGGNNRRPDAEPALGQDPSFSYDIDASRYSGGLEDVVRGFINGGNNRRPDAEPVLGQNPCFSYDQDSTSATDALNYSGGLEDVIRGFKFGGNDRHDAEAVLGQNPSFSKNDVHQIETSCVGSGSTAPTRRWSFEELRKFLESDTDEGSDTDKPLLHRNPILRDLHRNGRSCFDNPRVDEFICRWIKELTKFLKTTANVEFGEHRVEDQNNRRDTDELLLQHQNPSHPNFHQSGIITTLPLDQCNYGGGVKDQTKTPFDEIIDGTNLVTGDEVLMTTEFGFQSDLLSIDLFPIEEISQVDWDKFLSDDSVPSDDLSEGNKDGQLPFPSNNIIEIPEAELIEFGALDGWLIDYINGHVSLP